MNSRQHEDWKFESLRHLLLSIAESEILKNCMIFKGAFILNYYLPTQRISLDIDSNLDSDFLKKYPSREQQISFLSTNLEQSISFYFEKQDPVRYQLSNIRILPRPKNDHPKGWNGYEISITILDNERSGVRGLPVLTIDLVAPEQLSKNSVKPILLGASTIRAYSLERIAGEKARAYLSSLPTYRDKVKKSEKAVRVRDLYDLARILQHKTISEKGFWKIAGEEFKIACASRFVDCSGRKSFQEDWPRIVELYDKSPTIPKDIPFKEIEKSIRDISGFWQRIAIIPFSFPL